MCLVTNRHTRRGYPKLRAFIPEHCPAGGIELAPHAVRPGIRHHATEVIELWLYIRNMAASGQSGQMPLIQLPVWGHELAISCFNKYNSVFEENATVLFYVEDNAAVNIFNEDLQLD